MVLKNLRLVNFRKYTDSVFVFHEKTNFINGDNGSGKTSILEAIHYLSITKSFRTNNDSEAVNYQSDYFNIFGEFLSDNNQTILSNMNYSKTEGRSFLLNKSRVKRYTDVVGCAPVVILSPGLQKITEGVPAERRNFVNQIISQTDRDYLLTLIEYRRRISQRNAVLNQYREKKRCCYDAYFEAQDEIIARLGQKLFIGRQAFIADMDSIFKTIFARITHIGGTVGIDLKYNIKAGPDNFISLFTKNLRERFSRDLLIGRTTCGPHLDEIIINYNGRDIRQIGSQGEHKLILIALKLAEGAYIESHQNEKIIFLLDDLFAFLDGKHCRKIVEEIGDKNQALITSTDVKMLRKYGFLNNPDKYKIFNLTTGEA
jgi:DNA replication and repair protein RecF